MAETPLLEFKGINTYYGDLHVLKDVDYTIGKGEIISLLGGNACGKSTTMKTIMGVVRAARGTVTYEGQEINGLATSERVRRGIAPVLEARRLFPRMTVYENLEMGAYTQPRGAQFEEDIERFRIADIRRATGQQGWAVIAEIEDALATREEIPRQSFLLGQGETFRRQADTFEQPQS